MIMEQERKHWLLKTDKKKQIQDKVTGEIFQGRIDNLGSDVIIETEKLPIQDKIIKNAKFEDEHVADVLELATSAFPYIPELHGLMFTRLKSINLMSNDETYHNFRMVLKNCVRMYLPIAGGNGEIFSYYWVRTTDPPELQMMDDNGEYTIIVPVQFSEGVTNPVYYYPLDEELSPINFESKGYPPTITTNLITEQESIGLPLVWFTCDESTKVGPRLVMTNNTSMNSSATCFLLASGYDGKDSQYKIHLYPATGERDYVGPTHSDISEGKYKIVCRTDSGVFTGEASDFTKKISGISYVMIDGSRVPRNIFFRNSVGDIRITMTQNVGWAYNQEDGTYEVPLAAFEQNLYENKSSLTPVFDVQLDESIPFSDILTDVGYAGVRFGSTRNYESKLPRYPHEIDKMSGLPDWVQHPTDESAPQHLSVYAIHNTPSYAPTNQDTRQIAAIILDPGVERDYEKKYHPGKYRITKVDIVNKGSGYTTTMHGTGDRVWIIFNDGSRSGTMMEVTNVDENGGVLAVNVLYSDEGDDIGWERFEESYDPVEFTGSYLRTAWNTVDFSEEELVEAKRRWEQNKDDGSSEHDFDHGYLDTSAGPIFWKSFTSANGQGLVVAIKLEYLEEVEAPYSPGDVPTEEIGRAYLLSNDDTEYRNNARAINPKPARTIARICDIPTSVMQLSNISGLAPTSIVDKSYVRSEASYTAEDKERLYNHLKDRWVKPTHLDDEGKPIYPTVDSQNNQFIFTSLENLTKVDLWNHNDFRFWKNLNVYVDPQTVSVYRIADPGSGYVVGSQGTVVIGGFAYHYEVMEVNAMGCVLDVAIAPSGTTPIHLSNFDMYEGTSGFTRPYGTSPLESYGGTGLKLQFQIDGYMDLLPKKGEIVNGLHAFVREESGIWLYEYRTETNEWVQNALFAESNVSDTTSTEGTVSTRDSYINSIIPSIRSLPVSVAGDMTPDTTVMAFVTPSFVNVIDKNTTPVWIPDTSGNETIDDRTVVDFNKFYCHGLTTLTAMRKDVAGVIDAIKKANADRFDSYIIWKWLNPGDSRDLRFEFGVLHRSFNNLISTDSTSFLPENELTTKNFVHTNPGTTIVWNVDHVGPMMWVFNPYSTKHEKYYVNAHTRDLYIVKEEMSWANVEVTNARRDQRIVIYANGALQYNILTNNNAQVPASTTSAIYQQPEYQQLSGLLIGTDPSIMPVGNWELVFPELHAFKLKNVTDGREFTPVKMQILRGANISTATDVLNENGEPVNYKTLLVDENNLGRIEMRLYNQETESWDTI